jgi:hypothetical protein
MAAAPEGTCIDSSMISMVDILSMFDLMLSEVQHHPQSVIARNMKKFGNKLEQAQKMLLHNKDSIQKIFGDYIKNNHNNNE